MRTAGSPAAPLKLSDTYRRRGAGVVVAGEVSGPAHETGQRSRKAVHASRRVSHHGPLHSGHHNRAAPPRYRCYLPLRMSTTATLSPRILRRPALIVT
jgi:hypothetical protein